MIDGYKIDIQENSCLNGLTSIEVVDIKVLDKLIKSDLLKKTFHNEIVGVFYENELQQLIKLKKNLKKTKKKNVKYTHELQTKYKKGTGIKAGRVFVKEQCGLFPLRRELRQTIAKPFYVDIDMKNCFPVLTYNIMVQNQQESKWIKKYVENRDEYINKMIEYYDIPYETCKKFFLIGSHCGNYETWRYKILSDKETEIRDKGIDNPCNTEEYNIIFKNIDKPILDFMKGYLDEVKIFSDLVYKNNPELVKQVKNKKKEDFKKNPEGSVLGYYLQEIENQMLGSIYSHCIERGYIKDNNMILCFDGLMLRKEFYKPECLEEFNKLIKTKYNFDVKFEVKEMTQDYLDILDKHIKPNEEKEEIEFEKMELNDEVISEYIYDKIIDNLLFDENENEGKGQIYWYYENEKLWRKLYDKDLIVFLTIYVKEWFDLYINNILSSIPDDNEDIDKEQIENDLNKVKNLHLNKSKLNNLCEFVYLFIRTRQKHSQFIIENIDKKVGFLPLKEGKIYNMIENKVQEREREHYFTFEIDSEYKTEYDKEWVNNYFSSLIIKDFKYNEPRQLTQEEIDYVENLKMMIAYGITGMNNLKKFYVLLGPRNAGKSILLKIIQKIFGSFVGTANEKVFKQSKERAHDQETFSLLGNRISYVSELSEKDNYNETLIKKITGGDAVNIRRCGIAKNEEILFNTILLIATNEVSGFSSDEAFRRRLRVFDFPNQYKEGDKNFMDILKTKYNDIFSSIVEKAHEFFINDCEFEDVKQVKEATKNVEKQKDTIELFINDECEITNNKTDRIKRKDLFDKYMEWCGSNYVALTRNKFMEQIDERFKFKIYGNNQYEGIKYQPRSSNSSSFSYTNPLFSNPTIEDD